VPIHALDHAAAWLGSAQRDNGSFRGGTSTPGPNANSTGLAAQALKLLDQGGVADAAKYIKSLQLTRHNAHGRASRDRGAIAYNKAGLKGALSNGIQADERDQFRRATAQAIFALIPKPLTTLRVR
jgi:hypothetical protein